MSDTDCIQVAVRIRPLVPSELTKKCSSIIDKPGSGQQVVVDNGKSMYSYNYVFTQLDTQEYIYDSCVKKMLDKLFQGYNATILAYGQTGSGKTHTMGTTFNGNYDENMGVIPRAVIDIFSKLDDVGANHNTITCSFLELYQEQLFDLLSEKPRDQSVLDIREAPKGIIVPGLTEKIINNPQEAIDWLIKGSTGRVVGATAMNSVSSRSHAIFTITLKFVCEDKVIKSKFHLVDLAGSERSNKTKAIGDRFKEGVQINKGLLALSKVIAALEKSSNGGYVGYRDSKLTRLLQDSLGGNSVTLMIACVSPADYNLEETLSTLRYADQAKRIKNKPIVNLDSDSQKLNKIKQTVFALELKLNDLKNAKVKSGGNDEDRLQKEIEEIKLKIVFHQKCLQQVLDEIMTKQDMITHYDTIFKELEPKLETIKSTVDEMSQKYPNGFPFEMKIDVILLERIQNIRSILADYELANQQLNIDVEHHSGFIKANLTEDEVIEVEKITEKQLEYLNQVQEIDKIMELKFQLIKKINEQKNETSASNVSNNDSQGSINNATFNVSTEGLTNSQIQAIFDNRVKELDNQKKELLKELEKNKSNAKGKFNAEELRLKLKELEADLKELRQNVLIQSKALKMKEKDPKKIKTLENEIAELKRQKQRLNETMKIFLKRFDAWKAEKNAQFLQEENHFKQTEVQVKQCNVKYDAEQYELRRQIEEANERKNRLKAVLENINKNKNNTNIADFIENAMNLLTSSIETKTSLNELMITRTNLYSKLAKLKGDMSPNKREIANLEEDLELRNAQINDLREKVYSSNIKEQQAKLLERIQTMGDGKIVIKYCIDLAVKLKTKLSNSTLRYEEIHGKENKNRTRMELLEYSNETALQENNLKLKQIQMGYDDKITILLRELNNQHSKAQSSLPDENNSTEELFDEIEEIRQKIEISQNKNTCLLDEINEIKNHSRITRNSFYLLKEEENGNTDGEVVVIPETPYAPKIRKRKDNQRKKSIIKCGCKTGCKSLRCYCRKMEMACVDCACIDCMNTTDNLKENDGSSLNVNASDADTTAKNQSLKRPSTEQLEKTPKSQKLDHSEDVVTPTYPFHRKQRQAFYN